MQKWAQVAEESGSRVWARPRAACHLTPSQWRARHTGATPHSASRNRQTSPRAKSRRWGYHHSPAGRHKSADEMALPSALQSGSTRHEARSGWSIQIAPRCALSAKRRVMGDEPGAWTGARAGLPCRSRYTRENELTGSSECGPGNDMTHVWLSGPKDRRSPRLRPTIEQDVDLSAVSVVVDVSSADGRQQRPSNGTQRTLEYGPLNPAGSGPQP